MRTDAHRSETDLHEGDDLAFEQRQVCDDERQHAKDNADLDERNQNKINKIIKTHLSISPNTMSSVPITATTSATIDPITIWRSACRFTNDGGRTRARYACVAPSLTR